MSRTFNLADLKTIMSANNYDPLAHIHDILPNQKLRQRVLSSFAWYIDRQLASEMRSLYFKLYEQLSDPDCTTNAVDSYAHFQSIMNEEEARRVNLAEQGFMDGPGVGNIRLLICLRDTYHHAAEVASLSLSRQTHKVPTLEQLMSEDKPMKVDALSRSKTVALAKYMAKGDAAAEARFTAELIARKEHRAVDMHARRLEIVPALTGMLAYINNRSDVSEAEFHELPLATQRRLVQQLVNIIERTVGELSDDRTVSEFEYVKIMIEGEAAIDAVKAVLAQHTYAQLDDAIDAAVTLNHKRNSAEQERLDAALAG
jgi:hypothetical protein